MIRKAFPSDASAVVQLMLPAMGEIIFKLLGNEDESQAITFLEYLFQQKKNQYSYENTLVFEEDNEIQGIVIFYKGEDLYELRAPVLELAKKYNEVSFSLEDETTSGELYIDTLSVRSEKQGKGIGTKLLQYLQNYFLQTNEKRLGLLVSEEKTSAERLYMRLGFVFEKRVLLAGYFYKHLIFNRIQ